MKLHVPDRASLGCLNQDFKTPISPVLAVFLEGKALALHDDYSGILNV